MWPFASISSDLGQGEKIRCDDACFSRFLEIYLSVLSVMPKTYLERLKNNQRILFRW